MSLTPNTTVGASASPALGEPSAVALFALGDPSSVHPIQLHPALSEDPVTLPLSSATLGAPVNTGGSPPSAPQPGTVASNQNDVVLQASSSTPAHGAGQPSDATSNRSAPATAPCGACKFLRRKCTSTCVFASHFQPDQSPRFANVHKIFGASNVAKWLQELPAQSRDDAVNSLCYEADARIKDPVYGCVGALFALQQQVVRLQAESAAAQAELGRLRALAAGQASSAGVAFPTANIGVNEHLHPRMPAQGHQLAMVPSFVPSNMPPNATMLLSNMSGYDHGIQPPGMPMYNAQLKGGAGLGAAMLSSSQSATLPMYSLSGQLSSPSLAIQGLTSTPSSLKLSPQNMSLRGVPSSCSTNGSFPTIDSPGNVTGRGKRPRSEQGPCANFQDPFSLESSGLQAPCSVDNFPMLGPSGYAHQVARSSVQRQGAGTDLSQHLLAQHMPMRGPSPGDGLR